MEIDITRPHSEVSASELLTFASLGDLNVVFDVGARMEMDVSTVPCVLDYLEIRPTATYHLFEPNPEFAQKLREATEGRSNVIVNQFGLGDKKGEFIYNHGVQGFSGGDAYNGTDGTPLPVTTLLDYCKEHKIEKIDLLKIDTEGYEYKILKAAKKMWPNIHYIQYEEWDDKEKFYKLLGKHFDMIEIGFRNVLCTNKSWS